MNDLHAVMNRLAALAHVVGTELEDLYVLGYEKSTTDAVKVSGGDVVDLHSVGDPRARNVIKGLEKYGPLILEHLDNAIGLLHATGPKDAIPRTRKQITKAEHEQALHNQKKRKERGEYTPVKTQPQPGIY